MLGWLVKFSFLSFKLCLLQDDVCLASLENLAVDLTIPLKGGKVHGSLARAGKVRGQTPKVRTNMSVSYKFFVLHFTRDFLVSKKIL